MMSDHNSAHSLPSNMIDYGKVNLALNGLVWSVAFIALLLVMLGKIAPIRFDGLGAGLDPSWVAVLSEAHRYGWRFGTDIVFTGGPLSSLYTHYFQQETAVLVLWLAGLVLLFVAVALARLPSRGGALFVAVAALVWTFTLAREDAVLMSIPLLLMAISLKRPERTNWAILIAGTLASAASVLAKFSGFPVILLACLALDAVAVAYRRLPLHLMLVAIFCALLFAAAGQNVADLGAYIWSSLQTSASYSAAMGIRGPTAELAVWLLAAATLAIVLLEDAWRSIAARRQNHVVAATRVLVSVGFLFVAFKAGFVRHDAHSLIAWSALVTAGLVYAGIRWPFPGHGLQAVVVAAVIVTAMAGGHAKVHSITKSWQSLNPMSLMLAIGDQVAQLRELVATPGKWLEKQRANKERSYAAVRTAYPLPQLDGPVDMISFAQSTMIANGLDYRPRPTVQEYATYSEPLIERNRVFFTGARAPKYLFFAPGSIDERHPASAEGALWPLFLRLYEPVDRVRDMLLLKRRNEPLADMLGQVERQAVRLDEPIRLPPSPNPVFMALDIRPTLLGRLIDFVFKPPFVTMTVRYSDGTEGVHRIIPRMARSGMVVSPLVGSLNEFAILAAGDLDHTPLKWPESVRISAVGFPGSLAYAKDISVSFSRLDVSELRRAAASNPFLRRQLEQVDDIRPILTANKMTPPTVSLIPDGVFAHAPAELGVDTGGAKAIALAFGIVDGAWKSGNETDGVCFAVLQAETKQPLWRQCLDPRRNVADRGRQEARVPIPEGTASVILSTSCSGNCSWDWSYWAKARPL